MLVMPAFLERPATAGGRIKFSECCLSSCSPRVPKSDPMSIPASSTAAQHLPKSCSGSRASAKLRPRFDQNWPMLVYILPSLAPNDECRPKSANLGHILANVDHNSPMSVRSWLAEGSPNWLIWVGIGQVFIKAGPHRKHVDQHWPILVGSSPGSLGGGRSSGRVASNCSSNFRVT